MPEKPGKSFRIASQRFHRLNDRSVNRLFADFVDRKGNIFHNFSTWWKGTTIGGIVLKLQVVRSDGRSPSFLVAFVRALAGAFSAVVFFLGFFWIGWDADKQGWHDKIAGTYVVRLPRVQPLVCL